jgi:hypothetical protein
MALPSAASTPQALASSATGPKNGDPPTNRMKLSLQGSFLHRMIVTLNDVTADAEAEESEQELGRCAGAFEEFSNLVYREVHQ